MKFSIAPRPSQLSEDQYSEFCHFVDTAIENQSRLSSEELDFVSDMEARHEKYDRKTYWSEKQLAWLRKIYERVTE